MFSGGERGPWPPNFGPRLISTAEKGVGFLAPLNIWSCNSLLSIRNICGVLWRFVAFCGVLRFLRRFPAFSCVFLRFPAFSRVFPRFPCVFPAFSRVFPRFPLFPHIFWPLFCWHGYIAIICDHLQRFTEFCGVLRHFAEFCGIFWGFLAFSIAFAISFPLQEHICGGGSHPCSLFWSVENNRAKMGGAVAPFPP